MHLTSRFRSGVATLIMLLAMNVAPAESPPNVVFILSDDQAWGDYSFMGHPHIQTPCLDRLASQSLVFTRGYVPDSLCRPSLASIITGLHPHQHRIVGNDPPPPAELANLAKNKLAAEPLYHEQRAQFLQHMRSAPALPRLLSQQGYMSLQTGKWWEGHYNVGGFTDGMTHGQPARGGRHGDVGLDIGRKTMEPIAKFLDKAKKAQRPFFVWYAPMLPHTPHNPPEELLAKYKDKTPHLSVAKYWAMCEWFDQTIGQLMGMLDERGLTENTLVAYVTDNGWITSPTASVYAPRSKRSQYEGGIRTPIMLRWPAKIKPRKETEQLASSIDLVPTVLAAVGKPPIEPMRGINLLDENAVRQRDSVFGGIFEHDIAHMTDPVPSLQYRWVIQRHWKLIDPYLPHEKDGKRELFDLQADPAEERDLLAQQPEVAAKLLQQLDAWWTPITGK